ncbi:MAG: hypothetical protein R3F17_07970 [Planctomycetota bacterium]
MALFDEFDGSLINATFIDMTISTGTAPGTPIEALQAPNGEIWISDQIADRIFRFSGDGTTYLGESSVPLDNVQVQIAYGYVWVSNSGATSGAPGDALVQLDMNLNLVAVHTVVGDPFDAQAFTFNGVPGLLIPDIAGDDLLFFDPCGTPGTTTSFHLSDGVTHRLPGASPGARFQRQRARGRFHRSRTASTSTTRRRAPSLHFVDTGVLFATVACAGSTNSATATSCTPAVRAWRHLRPGRGHFDPGAEPARVVSISKLGNSWISSFCAPASNNSTGGPVTITGSLGSGVGSGLHLDATGGPTGEFGYFLVGTAAETVSPWP